MFVQGGHQAPFLLLCVKYAATLDAITLHYEF